MISYQVYADSIIPLFLLGAKVCFFSIRSKYFKHYFKISSKISHISFYFVYF